MTCVSIAETTTSMTPTDLTTTGPQLSDRRCCRESRGAGDVQPYSTVLLKIAANTNTSAFTPIVYRRLIVVPF